MAKHYRGYVGPDTKVTEAIARSTASRKLAGREWHYLVLITGDKGFTAVFDAEDEAKATVLAAVYATSFRKRLETTSLNLAESLFVDILAYKPGTFGEIRDFRVKHEGPMVRVLEANYDEGDLKRALRGAGVAV